MLEYLVGEKLALITSKVSGRKERWTRHLIDSYLASPQSHKVFILYGLKLTVKKTLMAETISHMSESEKKKTWYISIGSPTEMIDVTHTLKELRDKGLRTFLSMKLLE